MYPLAIHCSLATSPTYAGSTELVLARTPPYLRRSTQYLRFRDAPSEVVEESATTFVSRTERVQGGVGEGHAKRFQHVTVGLVAECGSAVHVRTAESVVAALALARLSVSRQEEAAGSGQEEEGGLKLHLCWTCCAAELG